MENKKDLEVLIEGGFRELDKYLDVKYKEVHDEFDKVQDKLNKFNNNAEIIKLLNKIDGNLERQKKRKFKDQSDN